MSYSSCTMYPSRNNDQCYQKHIFYISFITKSAVFLFIKRQPYITLQLNFSVYVVPRESLSFLTEERLVTPLQTSQTVSYAEMKRILKESLNLYGARHLV